jgi:hypothetical protein
LLIEEILLWTLPSRVALAAEMDNYEDKEKNNKNSGENYVTELEWSQMEADLMEGNTVEWILSSFLGGQAEDDEEYSLEPNWRIHLSQEELTLMERCVMAEGGGESYECQVAIACVIVNRVLSESFPDTLTEVVTQSGQFSTWPNGIRCVNVTDSVRQAVREALTRAVYPEKILYFRANRYHEWGTAYCRIDNTYFSTP